MSSVSLSNMSLPSSFLFGGGVDSVWKQRCITAGKVGVGILCFSGIAAGLGSFLQMGGSQLLTANIGRPVAHLVGRALQQTGSGLLLAGKYAFLSVAVPTYAVGWLLPKWLATEAIPQMAMWSYTHAIVPISRGVVQVSLCLKKACVLLAQKIYQAVILPFSQLIKVLALWTWNRIVQGMDILCRTTLKVAKLFHQHVLVPCLDLVKTAAHWTWNRIVQGMDILCRTTLKVAKLFHQHVLRPFLHLVKTAAHWTWNRIVQGMDILCRAALKVVTLFHQYVLRPCLHLVKTAAHWTWNRIIHSSYGLGKKLMVVVARVLQMVRTVYQCTVEPCGLAMTRGCQWIWKTVVIPVTQGIIRTSSQTIHYIYHHVFLPLHVSALQFKKGVIALIPKTRIVIQEVTEEVVRSFQRGWLKVASLTAKS